MAEAPKLDRPELAEPVAGEGQPVRRRLLAARPADQERRTALLVLRRRWTGRLLVAAFVLTLTAILGGYLVRARRKERATPPPALPTGVNQRVSGYTFTRSEGGHVVFTVHAARTVATGETGMTDLEDVSVEIFGRAGDQHDLLRARHAQYDPQSVAFTCTGKVEIELNAPLDGRPAETRGNGPVYIETSQVRYRQGSGMLVAGGAVTFRVGAYSGSAKGMSYATRDQWIELDRDVRLAMAPPGWAAGNQQAGQGPASEVSNPLDPGSLPAGANLVTAGRLRYDKSTLKVTLWGPVEVFRAGGHIAADGGQVLLDALNRLTEAQLAGRVRASLAVATDPENRLSTNADRLTGTFDPASGQLSRLEMEGKVQAERVQLRNGGPGGKPPAAGRTVTTLAAQRVTVDFAGERDRVEPTRGLAEGSVRLGLRSGRPGMAPVVSTAAVAGVGVPATSGRLFASGAADSLSADQIRFTFRPGGESLDQADALGSGRITIAPADPQQQGERTVAAREFRMRFDGSSRLESLEGVDGVKVVSLPPAGTPPGIGRRETSSDHLLATLDPVTQAFRSTRQWGKFRFDDGQRQASADKADYLAASDLLTLAGNPQVWDAETRIRADRIQLHADSDVAEGVGRVQTTHFGGLQGPPAENAEGPGAARTASSPGADTTNVLADRAVSHQRENLIHYEGHVRAWHGPDVIETASLDYDGKRRMLSSGSAVLTSLLTAPPPSDRDSTVAVRAQPNRGQGRLRPLTIRADHFDYLEAPRKASYWGDVQAVTDDVTIRSGRLSVYFAADSRVGGSRVDRVVADDQVLVIEPGRRVTGDHADYEVASRKITMTGGPPTAYDEERGFTTGRSLTFFIRDDRLLVDGGEKSRAISKHRIAQ